jgi:hypothetical protein
VARNAIFRRQNDRSSIRSQKRIRFPNGSIAPVSSVPHGVFSRPVKAGPHVAIGLRADFAMEFLDAAHHHAQPCAWTTVSMMLAQVKDQVAARHLAVERRPLLDLRRTTNWGSLLAPAEVIGRKPGYFLRKARQVRNINIDPRG